MLNEKNNVSIDDKELTRAKGNKYYLFLKTVTIGITILIIFLINAFFKKETCFLRALIIYILIMATAFILTRFIDKGTKKK